MGEIRLFEQVFMDYTTEYLKGPMYWVVEKEVGYGYAQDPDNIMYKNGKMTNGALQYLKNWSFNELAFVSVLISASVSTATSCGTSTIRSGRRSMRAAPSTPCTSWKPSASFHPSCFTLGAISRSRTANETHDQSARTWSWAWSLRV